MADPHDSIRAALDYDVIIRDALYGVPSGAVNDLVERLADVLAPKTKRDPLTDPPTVSPLAGVGVVMSEYLQPGDAVLLCGRDAFDRIKAAFPSEVTP